MSFGNVCKHCGHYEGDHDKDGKCHFQHRSVKLEQTIAKIEALPTDSGLFPFEWIKHFGKEGWSAIDGQQIIPSAEIKAIAAEVKWLNYILETIRNMSVYIHEKDPNPDPQFMADFYKTKLADAVDYARKILEGE